MFKDIPQILKITLPALSSTETATLKLKDIGLGAAEQESLKVTPLTTGNYTVAKKRIAAGDWKVVITATGSVSANTVALLHVQVIDKAVEVTLTKDA